MHERPNETNVNDRGRVTIPAAIRRQCDIDPGDKLRWDIDDNGHLSVEVVRQRFGAFDDFDAVPMGGDGLETHDLAGQEEDSVVSEDFYYRSQSSIWVCPEENSDDQHHTEQ